MSEQYPLMLPHRAGFETADYLVSDCNRAAYDLIAGWLHWPNRAAAIWGEAGAGKTHLAHVWMAAADARPLGVANLIDLEPALFEGPCRFAFDLDGGALPPEAETAMFHLLNAARERRGAVLILARAAPARWGVALPDLASRLRALPATEVGQPDDRLFSDVLAKLFADRQLAVDRDTLDYLTLRSERSFEAAQRLVARLDLAALAMKRSITKPLARDVLAEIADEQSSQSAG